MATHLEHELVIDAPVAVVWKLTEEVEQWPATTPTISSVERLDAGPMRIGSSARVKQPGQRAAVWTVSTFRPNEEFAWGTKAFGIRMVGTHRLTPVGADRCRNTLTLDLSGRGAALVGRLAGKKILAAITTENEGFKRAAETLVRGR
jgi:uncharacterized membrane protein